MTAYILTPEQHAQIVDALDFVCRDGEREVPKISLVEALAILRAMTPVDAVGFAVPTFGFDNSVIKSVQYAGTVPLYAIETKT